MHKHRARKRSALGLGVVLAITSAVSVIAMSSPASAGTGVGVTYDKAGCNNDGTIVLPNGNGDFICDDADYTSGNLGSGWNELDLVPFRATVMAGNSAPASQTVTFVIAVDNMDDGDLGFDFLSEPVLNTDLSTDGCGPLVVGDQQFATPGMGGADTTLYRVVTLTIEQNAECVLDHFARLGLGSSDYSGSHLHWNLANEALGTAGIGSKEISIPANEIAPQSLSKDMTASQDSDHVWNIQKSPAPATLSFPDTCDPAGPRSASVAITVEWTKLPATPSGDITVVTNVYASNPASRELEVDVTDEIRSGTTVLDTASADDVALPANTEMLVLTHQTTVPAGTTNLNDVATATYTDIVTGIPIPGSATAEASATVQSSGNVDNSSAVITDVESISGAGFSYSVDSFAGASGSFDGGYIAGTETTGTVSWTSASQTDSGSVTFNKTVYAAVGSSATGSLSDTATVTGSDGFVASTDPLNVGLSSSASVDLTINKRRSPVTSEDQTFNFVVKDAADVIVASPSITVPGGTAANVDTSTTVTGLAPGTYTVDESATGPYGAQSASRTITLPNCSGSVSFTNSAAPAGARVEKITVPAGATVWEFTLSGPDIAPQTVSATAGAGYVNFTRALNADGGTYTITETAQSGWDPSNITGDFGGDTGRATTNLGSRTCSFTLDMPADSGGTFSCSFTNTQRGSVGVIKTVSNHDGSNPQPPSGTESFTFQLRIGATDILGNPGTVLETVAANAGNGGQFTFATSLTPGQVYQVCETGLDPAWAVQLSPGPQFVPEQWTNATRTVLNPNVINDTYCVNFTAQAGPNPTTITANNFRPPEGFALTIGYWKNHASCSGSNGKQDPTLNQVLASFPIASGQTTHGVYIGDVYVDTCLEAVRLLNKSTINSNKKFSSDPLFNLAAQLLAAKLNVQAGAGTCAAAITAINAGQALLDQYDFTGMATVKLKSGQIATANSIARDLDRYNNNVLC